MPFPLQVVADGDWTAVRNVINAIAGRLNPVLPQARVFNNANISITNNTITALTFNDERYDNGNLHSTSVNTGRLTAPITGLYEIGACVQWGANGTGGRLLRLMLNGVTVISRDISSAVAGALPTEQGTSTVYRLLAGEYVVVEVFQDSGGALNVVAAGNSSPEFWMTRLGGYVNMGVN